MVVCTVSVVFKLLVLHRRANKTCQGKLLVCTGLYAEVTQLGHELISIYFEC